MTKAKSLLLGSAAALATVSGAQAADLGLPVAAVNYVQICSIGSFTGFLLPGSDVCFDISGYARGQLTWSEEIDPFEWTYGDGVEVDQEVGFAIPGDDNAFEGAVGDLDGPEASVDNVDAANDQELLDAVITAATIDLDSNIEDLGYNAGTVQAVITSAPQIRQYDDAATPTTLEAETDAFVGALQFIDGTATVGGAFGSGDFLTGLEILNVDGDNDESDFTGNARLNFDAQTMTEYGLLRGFIRLDGENGNAANVDRAFVQMNMGSLGFTAGLADSAFDPVFTGYGSGAANGLDIADQASNQFSVNFAAGNGFTMSLSVEDDDARTEAIYSLSEEVLDGDAQDYNLWTLASIGYDGGASTPDFIAALRVDQAWGSAKLAGAISQVKAGGDYATLESEWGFAVSGSAELNIPFGVGSTFGVTAIYADGAQGFHGFESTVGNAVNGYADAIVVDPDGVNASLELTQSYMIAAGFNFGLNDYVSLSLDGSYADVDHYGNLFDGSVYHIRGGIAYTPVTNLTINAHVTYSDADFETSDLRTDVDDDEWSARFRVTRSF